MEVQRKRLLTHFSLRLTPEESRNAQNWDIPPYLNESWQLKDRLVPSSHPRFPGPFIDPMPHHLYCSYKQFCSIKQNDGLQKLHWDSPEPVRIDTDSDFYIVNYSYNPQAILANNMNIHRWLPILQRQIVVSTALSFAAEIHDNIDPPYR